MGPRPPIWNMSQLLTRVLSRLSVGSSPLSPAYFSAKYLEMDGRRGQLVPTDLTVVATPGLTPQTLLLNHALTPLSVSQ